MRKCLSFLLALGITSIFFGKLEAKELKIGYVDFLKVYNEYNKTKDYEKALEEKKEEKDKELKKKIEEIEKLQNKIQLLKEKEREKEKEDLDKAVKEYRELERKIVVDLRKERDEKMKEILQDIEKVIKEYAQKNNFDLILNENIILYSTDKIMDITLEIMSLINNNYKK